jgi:very-short-patch-repair endonuclease
MGTTTGQKISRFQIPTQHAIDPYIVDFYCHDKRLIVEVDGDIHLASAEEDAARQDYLEGLGFIVVRLRNCEVQEGMDRALSKISNVLENFPSPGAERGGGEV